MDKIKVLGIVGVGRSGSTLIETLLGLNYDLFPIGEFAMVWGEIRHGFYCGCGQPFNQCEFWTKVFKESLTEREESNPEEVLEIRRKVDRNFFIPVIQNSHLQWNDFEKSLEKYTDILSRVYKSIYKFNCNKIILDSSKTPAYFHILSRIPEIELNIIHLVRDSRAVTYSWQKTKQMDYLLTESRDMIKYGTAHSSARWVGLNLLSYTLKNQASTFTQLRYEDFVKDPSGILNTTIKDVFGEEFLNQSNIKSNSSIQVMHGILGNPTPRKQPSVISIKPDMAWKDKLSIYKKILIFMLTWPLLLKYGYFRHD